MFHPEPVHLARELVAEFLKEILPQELLLQRPQHTRLDVVTADRQFVRARALVASAKAREPIRRAHDVARATHAALGESGEQVAWTIHIVRGNSSLRRS